MAVIHLENVPNDVYQYLRLMAEFHHCTLEEEALNLLLRGFRVNPDNRSQAKLLDDMIRHSFTPPPGTPDSVELLREDRNR